MSRFIASPLVSRSRAGLARERAASVNLERIQRCWLSSRREVSRRNLVRRSLDNFYILPFFFFFFSLSLSLSLVSNPRSNFTLVA